MRVLGTLLIPILFVGCQVGSTGEMTAEKEAAIRAEIDSLTVEWWDAWKTFDWDRGFSFFEDGPNTTWAGAGETVYSVAEMREAWMGGMAGMVRQELEFTNARTVVLSPEIVWTLREGNGTVFDSAGNVMSAGQFIETAVWVKRGGEWKVLLGHDDDSTPIS